MKNNLKKMLLQDIFIGAWVSQYMEIPKRERCPMYVSAIFENGDLYLDMPGNEGDPFEAEIGEIRGIAITPETLRGFHFDEPDHNLFEKKCKGFKVVVSIFGHQHYKLIRAKIQHDNGGFQFDDNIIFIHQLQDFVFKSTQNPLTLEWL